SSRGEGRRRGRSQVRRNATSTNWTTATAPIPGNGRDANGSNVATRIKAPKVTSPAGKPTRYRSSLCKPCAAQYDSHSRQECSSYPYRRPEDLQKPRKALRPRSTCHPSERLAKIRLAIDVYSP